MGHDAHQPPGPIGRRVLLVEDNDDIRFLLRFWLEDDGRCSHVFETESPQRAIEAAENNPVDAVILDFMLAGGSAVDCLPALRAAQPGARIIVYTANLEVARHARVLDLGADALVDKVSVVVPDVVDLLFDDAAA